MKIAILLDHHQCLEFLAENRLEIPKIPPGCNTVWCDLILSDGRHAVAVNQTGFLPLASDNEEPINGLSLFIADEPPTPSMHQELHNWIESQLSS